MDQSEETDQQKQLQEAIMRNVLLILAVLCALAAAVLGYFAG